MTRKFFAEISIALVKSSRFNDHVFWDYSVSLLLLKCFCSIKTTKLREKNEVPRLHESILPVTETDIRSGYCFVIKVPSPSENPKTIWVIIFLKNEAPQNLSLYSNVNVVIKSFRDFTPYVNIKTPNILFLSISKCWSGRYHQRSWRCKSERGVALMLTFLRRFWTWTCETQSLQLC